MAPTTDDTADGPPRALLIAAVAIAVAAIIAVLAIAAVRQLPEQLQPVAIAAVPAPQADSPQCTALMAALPEQLGDYRRAAGGRPRAGGRRGVADRTRCRPGHPALRAGAARRIRRRHPAPGRRTRAVVRADRRGPQHLVRRRSPGIYSPDAAERVGPDADPGDLGGDRAGDARQAARPGARSVNAARSPGPARCPPSPPAGSGSPRRWPPTSSGTSRWW